MEKNINISYIKEISIYTDGSCLGNPGPGGWCYILTTKERKSKIIDSDGAANTTNNRMELQALLEAMKRIESIITINENTKISVYSDSQYVINIFKKGWADNWNSTGWQKGSSGKIIKNKDIIQPLYKYVKQYKDIQFFWVKGHDENELNNLCDKNAREKAELLNGIL